MDARIFRAVITTALTLVAASTQAGSYRTTNFVVSAPTAGLAEEIGHSAEQYRRKLAIEWLGKEMPAWAQPCPITAQMAPDLPAGGETSFVFDRGQVFGWRMRIQGSRERLLDSVLPHEVTHTIFATHFRRPLPRWADEGACTTVEHASEKHKQQMMLVDFLRTQRGIPFSKMFAMRDYPKDVLPLYSQGYSLARYLIEQGGKRKFLKFVGDGLRDNNWPRAVERSYGYKDLGVLQNTWLEWVRQGSPSLADSQIMLASNERPARRSQPRQEAKDAYPTDDEPRVMPVGGKRDRSASARGRAPQVKQAGWQPRNNDFVVPEDKPDSSETPGEDYARDELLPGPVDSGTYQVTRPHPPESTRQVILEWNRE